MTNRIHSPIRQAQDAALARGAKTFTFPEPCRNGHLAPRYAVNGNCTRCTADHNRNRHSKPDHMRQLKLHIANGRVTQLTQDSLTVSNTEVAKDRLLEITGRPVSLSLMHKAGMRLLTAYLNNAPAASNVMALFS